MSLQCVSILNWPGEEVPSTYKEWYNPAKNCWIALHGSNIESIEKEYSKNVKGKRTASRLFHCFGKGYSAIIDYNKMEYTLWIW